MMKIQITSGKVMVQAELYDTPTAQAIAAALPMTGHVNRWGGEIYFSIPVAVDLEADAREVLDAGELAFWPPGSAFCIFFGATPASEGDECRAASAVNVFGKVFDQLDPLWNVEHGAPITIECHT